MVSAHLKLSGLQQLPTEPQLSEALDAHHLRDPSNNGSSRVAGKSSS